MQASESLRRLVLEYYAAVNSLDEAAVKDRYHAGPEASMVGTDAHEWFVGGDSVIAAFSTQFAEYPDVRVEPGSIEAYEAGNAGWFSDRPTLRWGDAVVPTRLTVTALCRDGAWRIVQSHLSVARAGN